MHKPIPSLRGEVLEADTTGPAVASRYMSSADGIVRINVFKLRDMMYNTI